MKAPIKAKEAAGMLWEATNSLTPLYYKERNSKDILILQIKARAILYYRLCPAVDVFVTSTDTRECIRKAMDQNKLWTGNTNFKDVFSILTTYPIVSIDDLENEFIELCPDIDGVKKYLNAIVKPIYEGIPDTSKSLSMCLEFIKKKEADSLITVDEAKAITTNVYIISELIKNKWKQICHIYNKITQRINREATNSLQEQPKTFPQELDEANLKSLMQLLIELKLIDEETTEESFLYWFGYGKYKANIKPINWMGTKQLTRELLEGLYKSKYKPFSKIEKIVPVCFVQRGKPMQLAKKKEYLCNESDEIANFLAAL